MRILNNFALPLATLLFGFLLVPQAALAGATNCPPEPTRTTITDGEVFSGSNCIIHAIGDLDEFTFNGNSGETYQLAVALVAPYSLNVCLKLYDPSQKQINLACTSGATEGVVDQTLAVTGSYTMAIYEVNGNGTQNYAVSLERLYPFPPNAQQINTLGKVFNGNIFAPTDTNAWVFSGATTGTYEVTAALSSPFAYNVCVTVYSPTGKLVVPSGGTNPACTNGGGSAAEIDFTPTQAGQYMEFLQVAGSQNGTQTFTLEVSCLLGNCPSPYPPCTLVDAATYNATTSTLTMKFTVGNNLGTSANWSAWLTYADPQGTNLDTMQNLFSVSQPITNPPKAITKTFGLPKEGTVGVLSTLSTPHLNTAKTEGIACSSWVQINTGTEP
jgi:hypothetical protein